MVKDFMDLSQEDVKDSSFIISLMSISCLYRHGNDGDEDFSYSLKSNASLSFFQLTLWPLTSLSPDGPLFKRNIVIFIKCKFEELAGFCTKQKKDAKIYWIWFDHQWTFVPEYRTFFVENPRLDLGLFKAFKAA